MKELVKKKSSAMVLTLLLASMLMMALNIRSISAPMTWIVDDDGPANFHTIQEAIDSPLVTDGDTIFVREGTYYEVIELNKAVSLVGENVDTTILNGGGASRVVSVLANNGRVEGFSIMAGSTGISIGVLGYPIASSGNLIVGNLVTDVNYGICTEDGSSDNTISMNIIEANVEGIYLHSSNNAVLDNNITGNDIATGIYCIPDGSSASDNNISNNKIRNFREGIDLDGGGTFGIGENNFLEKNDIADCEYGICVYGTNYNDIIGNTISTIQVDGIVLAPIGLGHYGYWASAYNTVANNIITSNRYGILISGSWNNEVISNIIEGNMYGVGLHWFDNAGEAIYYSHGNKIIRNNIVTNTLYGVELWNASDNLIYSNNFLNNAGQVYSENSVNVWDNGYPSGGNYWSDYTDVDEYSGPNQDQLGSDYIWDHPYVIDADNQDHYPLVNKWSVADVNHDGVVNVVDAAGVSAHWYPGPPIGPKGYDPNFDINDDGVIDLLDAAMVSAYWTGPPKGPLAP